MLTISEWAKLNPDQLTSGIVEIFATENPVLAALPFINIAGNAYTYNLEQSLPGVAFRGFNEGYVESTGVVNPLTETLTILGGDSDFDVAQIAMQTGNNDTRAIHDGMKAKAATLTWLRTFFDGDTSKNPKEFDGLNRRLTGSQVLTAGTNGGTLEFKMLDELVDAVRGTPSILLMNKTLRRTVRQMARSMNALTITTDQLGRELEGYAGVPFGLIEEDETGADILAFDETQGTANATTSIYAVRFGADTLHGIQTKPIEARDLGEVDDKPALRTRTEWYSGFVIKHPKAAARLKGIKAA
ncbi:major capsid protein [Sphingomonas phyllosphaerae]|uniref:major capsid protein n=1 Tax=Sphingomonas phyllosphaerae TaxID=257003 RepID=UPI0003B3D27B